MWTSLVCVILLFGTDVVMCKPDYLFNQDVDGWLKLHAVPATWLEAFLSCHYEGAVLASPINAELATALRSIMHQSELESIFLGVNAVSQRDFMSVEGVPLADLLITMKITYNGKKTEDCLVLSTYGNTYISSCLELLPYICYKKRDNTTILNECGTFDDEYQLNSATGSCYKYHKKITSWYTAYKICAAEGGYLVIINDKREADIVTGLLELPAITGQSGDEVAHIGLRDWSVDQTWLTIHGEKIEHVYNTWGEGHPGVGNGYACSVIGRLGRLVDIPCMHQYRFICEKDPKTSRFEDVVTLD